MYTKSKITLLFLLLIAIMAGDNFYSRAVEPELATELAMKQFENPSIEVHTVLRNRESFNVFPYLYLGWVGVAVFSFRNQIWSLFENEKKS